MQDQNNVKNKAEKYLKESILLLKKYKLAQRLVVNFPRSYRTPLLSKIALWVVAKQGGILDTQFKEIKK